MGMTINGAHQGVPLEVSALTLGGTAVSASGAEMNLLDNQTITATGAIPARRFVDVTGDVADPSSTTVIGVAPDAISDESRGVVGCFGIQAVTADCPLSAADPIKVGVAGRATKHVAAQHTIQTTITGEATAFTQPGSASVLEVLQATDQEADRGAYIYIVGSDGEGDVVFDAIQLDATNTTTPVAGTTEFTKVSAAYLAFQDTALAADVTVRISEGGATVCTLPAGALELGADVPAQSQEAYCDKLTITGPNSDASYVTVLGVLSTDDGDSMVGERVQLDGASPAVATTSGAWRYIERICLGEFTNAATASVKTNVTVDTAAMECGTVVVAAAKRGDDAMVLVAPNV